MKHLEHLKTKTESPPSQNRSDFKRNIFSVRHDFRIWETGMSEQKFKILDNMTRIGRTKNVHWNK